MVKNNQDLYFLNKEGDKFFERNGPNVNNVILKAVNFLRPNKDSDILEIGCGCGSTLKKIRFRYRSNVYGVDTSKKSIEYAKKNIGLKNMFHSTFMQFKTKKKFDVVIAGGFLYVIPDSILKKTLKKVIKLMKKNSFLIIWDYDTAYNYKNVWKYDKDLKSYKRNLLKEICELDKNIYLISKQLSLKGDKKLKTYKNVKIDNIFSTMIFKNVNKSDFKREIRNR